MIEYKAYRKKSLGTRRRRHTVRHAARHARGDRRPRARLKLREVLPVAAAVLAVGLATAAGAAAYSWLGASPLFAVREIDLNPCAHLTREEVHATLSGGAGTNVWTLSPDEIARRLRSNPWVRAAAVRKVFPDRLVVRVEERRPAALVNLGALWYVDEEGTVFKRLATHDPKNFPIVTGFTAAELAARDAVAAANFRRALELLRAAEAGPLRGNVSEVHFDAQEGYTVVARDTGLQFRLGTLEVREAVRRIGDALPRLARLGQARGAVDLRHEGRIFVRPGE